MGKASRRRGSVRPVSIRDATQVIEEIEAILDQPDIGKEVKFHLTGVLTQWRNSPVSLRVNEDFAYALADTDTDIELTGDWPSRLPFGSMSFTLQTPLEFQIDGELRRFTAMVATGFQVHSVAGTPRPLGISLAESAAFTCTWISHTDDYFGMVPVTFVTKPDVAAEMSLLRLSDYFESPSALHQVKRFGVDGGPEAASFVMRLSLQLLLYLTAKEPDVDWIPVKRGVTGLGLPAPTVANLGWRIGSTLRSYRSDEGPGTGERGRTGWRMPPHIRRAHYHRVRVVTRDDGGRKTGSVTGEAGKDWHYELRWIPPTPVNSQHGVAPVVRAAYPAAL